MSTADIAAALLAARRDAKLAALPPHTTISRVEDAYAVQDEIVRVSGDAVRGWKVTALTENDQRAFSSDRPVAGALLGAYWQNSPAQFSLAKQIGALFECEIAFVLGADLPQRADPYSTDEIAGAIEAVVPVFEITGCRVAPDAPALLKLADMMGNGGFVMGQPMRQWRTLDLADIPIALRIDGDEAVRGTSARILGNPLRAVVALANAQPLPAGGLRRGQVITTGTCTDPWPLRAGEFIGTFGALGEVRVRFVD